MAQSHLHQSVLPAKPVANCDSYLAGLLTDLRNSVDAIPVVPGSAVQVPHGQVMDLRGVVSELIGAVRTELKWRGAL
jgi:hypothetical protein